MKKKKKRWSVDENAFKKEVEKHFTAKAHPEGGWRFVYANIDGYAVVEGGRKGGYLIRSIKTVFDNVDRIQESHLGEIILQINHQAKDKVGTKVVVQQIEDVNRMEGTVYFEVKQLDNTNNHL